MSKGGRCLYYSLSEISYLDSESVWAGGLHAPVPYYNCKIRVLIIG